MFEKIFKMTVITIIVVFLFTACGASFLKTALAFEAHVRVSDKEDTKITLGIHNNGKYSFPGDPTFNACMELIDQDTNQYALVELPSIDRIKADDTAFPVGLEGSLNPGLYTLTWGAPGYGSISTKLSIVDGEWTTVHVSDKTTADS